MAAQQILLGAGAKQIPVEYLVIAGGASGAGGGGYAGGCLLYTSDAADE